MIGELDSTAGRPFGTELCENRRAAHVQQRERWEVRAAQWKALQLARDAFGEEAAASLASYPSQGAYRGLVRLEVPFRDLDDHRGRENLFLAMAMKDPLLERVPLVFVFDPVLVPVCGRTVLEPSEQEAAR